MYKPLLFLSSFLFTLAFSYGQGSSIEKELDSFLSGQFKPTEPGGTVLVAKKGKILYNKAFGSAHLELNVPMKPDMVFKLASITKQFTAVAILQLVEGGKLSLKDSIQQHVPHFPSKGHPVTIENLLTHTSGIPDYMQIDYRNQNMERWDFTPRQLIDSFKHYPLQFAPGTQYSYSNSGYYILGYVIEQVSGKSYQQYIQEHILTPLGMTHSYFDSGGIVIPNRVSGYRKEGAAVKNADYWSPSIAYAAGGLLSNTEDLFKWFQGVLAYKMVKKETLQKAFSPSLLADSSEVSYGYGWQVLTTGAITSIEHGGHMNGFTTNQVYYSKQDVFIALLLNCQDAPRDELSKKISEIVLGQPLQKEVGVSDVVLNAYAGTYALATDPSRTIVVTKQGNRLLAKISGQQTFEILFQDEATFQLKNIQGMAGTFVRENGAVTQMVIEQNGRFEWKKIK